MRTSNIIAAGKMLAIALILIGIVICIATFFYFGDKLSLLDSTTLSEAIFSNIVCGLAVLMSAIALLVMFSRAEKHRVLATPILILGIFMFMVGIGAFCMMPRNPFTWIMALVCTPMFITALCLKINFAASGKS
jgi:hypothetical protein